MLTRLTIKDVALAAWRVPRRAGDLRPVRFTGPNALLMILNSAVSESCLRRINFLNNNVTYSNACEGAQMVVGEVNIN